MIAMQERTWRDYANRLTEEEVEILERVDLNPSHPDGAEGHRLGQIASAQIYVARRSWWRRLGAQR
ncbi:hypothetical protein JCM12141A_08980 [Mycolicibacterium hodleri]